jgi:hypothetical protein
MPVLVAAALSALLFVSAARERDGVVLLGVLPLVIMMLFFAESRSRALYEVTMPIASWATLAMRYGVRCVAVLAPPAVWMICQWCIAPREGAAWVVPSQAAQAMMHMLTAVTWPFALAVRPGRGSRDLAPQSMRLFVVLMVQMAVTVSAYLVGPQLQHTAVAVLLVTAVLLAIWNGYRVSQPLVSAGAAVPVPIRDRAARETVASTQPALPMARAGTLATWWLVLRVGLNLQQRVVLGILLALSFGMGVMIDGISQLLFLTYAPMQLLIGGTRFLSVLPVAPCRRLLLMLVMGPVAVCASRGLGSAVRAMRDHGDAAAVRREQYKRSPAYDAPFREAVGGRYDNRSRVSLAHWQWAVRAPVPTITAPWGETVAPYSLRVMGLPLYNPFTIRPGNTQAFAEWQWSRLTRQVYGMALSPGVQQGQWPVPRVSRWPVLIMVAGVLCGAILVLAFGVWQARRARFNMRATPSMVLGLSPILVPLVVTMGTPMGGAYTGTALLHGACLYIEEQLPAQPVVFVVSVLAVALIPVLLGAATLWSATRAGVVETQFPSRS